MESFKQFVGGFFGGEKGPKLTQEEQNIQDRITKLKQLDGLKQNKKEIEMWMKSGNRVPEDVTRLSQLDRQIECLERELENKEAV